jgi:two-component system, NarL family, nitrate/nitrite sensor histidine kinase NarX
VAIAVSALRWVAVILPVLVIGILDLITDHEWSDLITEPLNTLAVPAIVLLLALAVARIVFERLDRLTLDLRDRNAALEARDRENERLQRQVRDLAVSAERERIAEELHDGVAQVLAYVNAKAQAVDSLIDAGELDRARHQLSELAEAARSSYVDVRSAIHGLARPTVVEGDLVAALEAYAARFAEMAKLAVAVDATPTARALRLRPEAGTQILRIAGEALTNVRKHAAAQRAVIRVDVLGDDLSVAVEDDGRGFDPSRTGGTDRPRFGMRSIRDRARSIDGRAEWSSRPGTGTDVRLRVPVRSVAA